MDEQGIDRAVVQALDSPRATPCRPRAGGSSEQVESSSDRLIPFCSVDPRTTPTERRRSRTCSRVRRPRRCGFGELKPGLPIDNRRLETIYELCAEYELPILCHLDDVGLPGLEAVQGPIPAVDFIAHAHFWWAPVSGGRNGGRPGPTPRGRSSPADESPNCSRGTTTLRRPLGLFGLERADPRPEFGQGFRGGSSRATGVGIGLHLSEPGDSAGDDVRSI